MLGLMFHDMITGYSNTIFFGLLASAACQLSKSKLLGELCIYFGATGNLLSLFHISPSCLTLGIYYSRMDLHLTVHIKWLADDI